MRSVQAAKADPNSGAYAKRILMYTAHAAMKAEKDGRVVSNFVWGSVLEERIGVPSFPNTSVKSSFAGIFF